MRVSLEIPDGYLWCPECMSASLPDLRGRCTWCDTQMASQRSRPRGRRRAHAGLPVAMLPHVLVAAQRLYERDGLSFRAVARHLHDQTHYANERSMAQALFELAHANGWQVRDRIAATVRASVKHGEGRRGQQTAAYSRANRLRAAGRDACGQCAAIKSRPGRGRGERCCNNAMVGCEYCYSHDPSTQQTREEHLARARDLSPFHQVHRARAA